MPIIPPQKFFSRSPIRQREQTFSALVSDDASRPLAELFNDAAIKHQIKVPPNSRIAKYLGVVDDKNADLNTRIMARQELTQLLLSINTIGNLDEWVNTLQSALRYDAAIPDPNTTQTKGRDALFELYVAGRMQNIGIEVKQGEPDIICNKQGFKFSIAAKRIKSRSKLLSRVKEGRKQIERATLPGIVALDLSPLQDGYHGGIINIEFSEFSRRALSFLDATFRKPSPRNSRNLPQETRFRSHRLRHAGRTS